MVISARHAIKKNDVRLTKLKLAGFKSFVDPTTVLVPGQLVGVVGPNGCGKSNIIDAVRWVLGESKATALRGESMQDVIFNGSGTRKPVGRASVELVFDNALGRAAGQWSQYAEIAVKRVLDRNGNSSYYLNNLQVRRRDVIDVFLGTGLGPRAYAIIEQGRIGLNELQALDVQTSAPLRIVFKGAQGVAAIRLIQAHALFCFMHCAPGGCHGIARIAPGLLGLGQAGSRLFVARLAGFGPQTGIFEQ